MLGNAERVPTTYSATVMVFSSRFFLTTQDFRSAKGGFDVKLIIFDNIPNFISIVS